MKYFIILSALLPLSSLAQKVNDSKELVSLKPLYFSRDAARLDSNFQRLGYIPWRVEYPDANKIAQTSDTIWFKENAFDDDAEAWDFVVQSDSGDDKWYIRKENVEIKGNTVKTWMKTKRRTLVLEGKTYKNVQIKGLAEFDCRSNKSRILMQIIYLSTGKRLKVISHEFVDFTDIIPDTGSEYLLKATCKKYNR